MNVEGRFFLCDDIGGVFKSQNPFWRSQGGFAVHKRTSVGWQWGKGAGSPGGVMRGHQVLPTDGGFFFVLPRPF